MQGVLTLPNLVSVLRLFLIPVFLWLLFGRDDPAAAGWLLGFIGATDWIDGYLARRLNQVSELGKILDPVADRLAVAAAVIGGLIAGVLPAWFAWALILREVIVGVGAVYAWRRGVKLDVRFMGKTATFMLYGAITAFYLGAGYDAEWLRVLAYLVGVPGLVLYYLVGYQYVGDVRDALRQDTPEGHAEEAR